jgi:hypothetical protein
MSEQEDALWRRLGEGKESETLPHTMTNAVIGERHVIRLKPRGDITAAEAQAFLAERIAEGERIDPQSCEIIRYYAEAVDLYGIFEVPREVSCVGNEMFARNLPDGTWVWFGHLPAETYKALYARMDRERKARGEGER